MYHTKQIYTNVRCLTIRHCTHKTGIRWDMEQWNIAQHFYLWYDIQFFSISAFWPCQWAHTNIYCRNIQWKPLHCTSLCSLKWETERETESTCANKHHYHNVVTVSGLQFFAYLIYLSLFFHSQWSKSWNVISYFSTMGDEKKTLWYKSLAFKFASCDVWDRYC